MRLVFCFTLWLHILLNPDFHCKSTFEHTVCNTNNIELPILFSIKDITFSYHLVEVIKPNITFSFSNINICVFYILDFNVHFIPFCHLPRTVNDIWANIILNELVLPFIDWPRQNLSIVIWNYDFIFTSCLIRTCYILEEKWSVIIIIRTNIISGTSLLW